MKILINTWTKLYVSWYFKNTQSGGLRARLNLIRVIHNLHGQLVSGNEIHANCLRRYLSPYILVNATFVDGGVIRWIYKSRIIQAQF